MKKLISIGLGVVMIICLFGVAMSSNNNEISVYVNGERLEFDVPPQIIDNRTMVPMRTIFEALGAEVRWLAEGWFEEEPTIIAVKDRISIQIWIGKTEMHIYILPEIETEIPDPISPWEITLDVPPMLVDNRTLVPLRAVSEAFDAVVDWDEETMTISISTN